MAVPFVVIVAFVLGALNGGGGSGGSRTGPLPAIAATRPPNAVAETVACTKVLEKLPVRLGRLAPRVVHARPDTPFVVAWGDPAVVLRCGVDRPASLRPGSSVQDFAVGPQAGPFYDVTRSGAAEVYTTVDRGPYISITVPSQFQGGTVVPPLSRAIAAALPAVCSTNSATPDPDRLCTRRPS